MVTLTNIMLDSLDYSSILATHSFINLGKKLGAKFKSRKSSFSVEGQTEIMKTSISTVGSSKLTLADLRSSDSYLDGDLLKVPLLLASIESWKKSWKRDSVMLQSKRNQLGYGVFTFSYLLTFVETIIFFFLQFNAWPKALRGSDWFMNVLIYCIINSAVYWVVEMLF